MKEIEESENVKDIDELSKAHGINGQSCFSSLAGFDATKAFPSDYMHLADEGFFKLGTETVTEIFNCGKQDRSCPSKH